MLKTMGVEFRFVSFITKLLYRHITSDINAKSEDKLKKILPYMIKREIKIKFNKDKK